MEETKINPLGDKGLDNLRESMKASYKSLKPFRESQLAALKQYVGSHYSDKGTPDKVPVNYLELAISIYTEHLAAKICNVLIATHNRELKLTAVKLELAVNDVLKKIKFGKVIRTAVMQAMFSVGIVKKGLNNTQTVLIDGQYYPLGQVFAANVSLDNWVHDMFASNWDGIQYCGDRHTLPYQDVKDDENFTKEFRDKLSPKEKHNPVDDEGEKAEEISQSDDLIQKEYKETVQLWDIWLPMEGVVITFDADSGNDEIGRIVEWQGPKSGPYNFLGFNDVIDNIMPLAPVDLWQDLNSLANKLFRKLGRQANRQKTLTGVRVGSDKDANTIKNANDGDIVGITDPKGIGEIKSGGIDQQAFLFLLQVKELATYMYGNLDALGGLSRMSETIGQDQMLTANAGNRLEAMQERTIEFTTDVVTDLAWYVWTDPIREYPVTINKYGTSVGTSLSVMDRATDFFHFNFEIEPFSMQHQSPAARLSAIAQIFERFIAPYAAVLAQRGIFVDFEALLKIIAKYANLPEINDILTYTQPQHPAQAPGAHQAHQSPVTTRNYVRENRPGATQQGKDSVMQMLLSGGNPQNSQKAQLTG